MSVQSQRIDRKKFRPYATAAVMVLVIMLIACGSGGKKGANAKNDVATEIKALDDLTHFISRYGAPDAEESSENEVPRPLIVTRRLIYKKENLRVVYVPDATVGTPPPYKKWKLFGLQNHESNAVIEPAEVLKIMMHRDRKK